MTKNDIDEAEFYDSGYDVDKKKKKNRRKDNLKPKKIAGQTFSQSSNGHLKKSVKRKTSLSQPLSSSNGLNTVQRPKQKVIKSESSCREKSNDHEGCRPPSKANSNLEFGSESTETGSECTETKPETKPADDGQSLKNKKHKKKKSRDKDKHHSCSSNVKKAKKKHCKYRHMKMEAKKQELLKAAFSRVGLLNESNVVRSKHGQIIGTRLEPDCMPIEIPLKIPTYHPQLSAKTDAVVKVENETHSRSNVYMDSLQKQLSEDCCYLTTILPPEQSVNVKDSSDFYYSSLDAASVEVELQVEDNVEEMCKKLQIKVKNEESTANSMANTNPSISLTESSRMRGGPEKSDPTTSVNWRTPNLQSELPKVPE
ncbi:hypothetical protein LSTR_LSTR017522 [Laodelphax striatellus]|uniref:Uncharacterized protein n=1 Tax=Laodelphax striatellus TaxID=195883 RepID=A0A482WJI8_LAOST|nr:hypothetical protein LSTR_LSTR017522 [Laodelphax striatellus]